MRGNALRTRVEFLVEVKAGSGHRKKVLTGFEWFGILGEFA